jgi:hypothetical protein
MICHLHAAGGRSPMPIVQKGGCATSWIRLPLPGIVAKKREEKAARKYKEEHEGSKVYEWKEKEKEIISVVTVNFDVAFLFYEAVSNAFYIVLTCTMTDELERTWKKAVVP